MNGLELCSGIGGIGLGLQLAIPDYRTVCHVEWDSFAAAVLVARMEDQTLDQAPIWDDLTTFDGTVWRGKVDIITAGFPCQPWSVAGKQEGLEDDRWLWPDINRIISEVQPEWVFLENVPGLLVGGLAAVLNDLTAGRFDAEWDCFRASDLEAPHKRERVFILAHATGCSEDGLQGRKTKEQPITRLNLTDGLGRDTRKQMSTYFENEPRLERLAYGVAYRMDRLRALGNAVVPAVAALAFKTLYERIDLE